MNAALDKPKLWSLRETAKILGLNDLHGYRTIADLVAAHNIPVQRMASARGVDRAGLKVLAKALNRTLNAT